MRGGSTKLLPLLEVELLEELLVFDVELPEEVPVELLVPELLIDEEPPELLVLVEDSPILEEDGTLVILLLAGKEDEGKDTEL